MTREITELHKCLYTQSFAVPLRAVAGERGLEENNNGQLELRKELHRPQGESGNSIIPIQGKRGDRNTTGRA